MALVGPRKSGQYEDLDGAAARIVIDLKTKAAADLQEAAGDCAGLQKTATRNCSISNLAHNMAAFRELLFLRLTSTNLRQRKETMRRVI
nr:cbb3-type cytochrome oxidase assembly protein [Mesorhizobium sp. B2-3-15]